MSMRVRGPLGVVVSGLLMITLVGCGQRGAAKEAPPVTPASSDTPSATPTTPAPPPQRPKAPVPADRDPAAVSAALTGLDACALLARVTVTVPGLPANAERVAWDPHTCVRKHDSTDAQVSVNLGNGAETPDRFDEQLLTVAGAKAYFFHYGGDSGSGIERCRVGLPVSFQDTIDVEISLVSKKARVDLCRRLVTAAAVPVVKALATPQAFPNRLPKAHRDTCVVLARALGEPLKYPDFRHIGSVDWCKKEVGERSIGLNLSNSSPDPDRPSEKTLRIAGKTVEQNDSVGCRLTWSDGPSGVPRKLSGSLMVELDVDMQRTSADCVRARTLAPAVMRELAKPAPAVTPQQPLTYRPGESDVAAAGACADLWRPRSCAPYKAVPAARGADEVLRRVQADPNAACAIAVDTVRKQLGPAYRPVTDLRRNDPSGAYDCAFVEPSHGLTVWVGVAPPKPGETVYPTLRIAGRPASIGSAKLSEEDRIVRLDTVAVEVAEQVELSVGFEFGEPRSPVVGAPVRSLDDAQLTRLRQVATGIVASSV